MSKIYHLSVPRTGSHLLKAMFLKYLTHYKVPYDVFNVDAKQGKESSKYYKSHDLVGTMPKNMDHRYIVQIRLDVPACLYSWYEFELRGGSSNFLNTHISKDKESKSTWLTILNQRLDYWRFFMFRWCYYKRSNIHYVIYEQLISDPENTFTKALSFMCPDLPINKKLIKQIIKDLDIRIRRNNKHFKYYDKEVEEYVKKCTSPYLKRLRSIIDETRN